MNSYIRKKIYALHVLIKDFIERESKISYQNVEDENNYLESVLDDIERRISATQERPFMFARTYCSQCGGEFGPGNSGFSHCEDHKNDRRLD